MAGPGAQPSWRAATRCSAVESAQTKGGALDWTDLETFLLAVQQGSLSKAARRLEVSQPAVSARIRRLESSVHETLLRRSGRGVRPTPAGALLYERAIPLVEALRGLADEIGGGGDLRGRLHIGCTDLVAVHHLPSLLRRMRKQHRRLELSVHVEGTAPLLALLDAGEVEIVLGTLPVPEGRYQFGATFHDPLVIIAPPDHPLGSKRNVAPELVAAEPWILHKTESVTRHLVDGFFNREGVSLRTEMEISSPEAIRELVRAGLGLSVLPERAVRREIASGRVSRIAVRGFLLERSSGWIVPKDRPLSRGARALRLLLDTTTGSRKAD